ncbi:sensor histidine kinase [Terriglobus albidus]|nr:sensor histidine kinase [Terriglobus albidus]
MLERSNSDRGIAYAVSAPKLDSFGIATLFAVASILAVLTARECHLNLVVHHIDASFIPSLCYGLATWLWWAAITTSLWAVAVRVVAVIRFSMRVATVHFAVASLLAAAHLSLLRYMVVWASQTWPAWGGLYRNYGTLNWERFGLDLILYGFIYGISCLLHSKFQNQYTTIQKLEVERQLTQAQLKALQMQMEPHFLFNTLNALSSLVAQGRNKEASRTLEHLDTILRTTLRRRAPEKVPFAEELRVIESYLAIQQVRFAHRLQVKIEASPEALEGLVPCFLLQPLVENAIRHGIAPMEGGGLIETSVKRVGNQLWLQVRDNGSGPSASTKGHGIGMQNTKERLAYFYPGAHEICAVAPAEGGYEVTIQIPYERRPA